MKAQIAIFVHVSSESFGLVHGELDFCQLPRVGDKISFTQPVNQSIGISKDHPLNPLILTVSSVTHQAGSTQTPPLIDISDLDLDTVADAQQLFVHMVTGFGLHAETWTKN